MPGRNPALVRLVLANLDRLGDGEAGEALRRAVEECVADMKAYGWDGQVRKVELSVGLREVGTRGRVELTFTARAKVPRAKVGRTVGYFDATVDSVGVLFNPASAAEPDQMVIPLPGVGQ